MVSSLLRSLTSNSTLEPSLSTATSTGVENTSGYSPIRACAFATISSSRLIPKGALIRPCALINTLPISPVNST